MSMEKRGVVDGEGADPVKQAADKKCPDCGHAPGERGACGTPKQAACGTDPMSKLAEAVADKTAQPAK